MEILSRYLNQIKAQLRGLTVSQRLLIGLLIVVMVGTVFFVVEFSRKPEMVEVLPQSASPEQISTIVSYLKGKYTYQVVGDKVMVPVEQAYQIRGELAMAQALPRDTTIAFSKLAETSFSFDTDANTERRYMLARQETLARVIRCFPDVNDATVIIAMGSREGLGRSAIPTTATVSLQLKSGDPLPRSEVISMVDLVRGAVGSGLKRDDVHVTDGMRPYNVPSEDSVLPTDLLDYKKAMEADYVQKLIRLFENMGDVKIAVNVVPDMSARTIKQETYDPKGIAAKVVEEQTKDATTSEGSGVGGQPGVQPNVSVAVGSGAVGGEKNSSSTTDSTTKTDVRFSVQKEDRTVPAGTEIKDMTATISIPRTYFLAVYRRDKKDIKAEPTDNELQGTMDTTIARLQKQAKQAIGVKTDEQIRIDWFDDTPLGDAGLRTATAGMLAGGGSMGNLVTTYAKQAILGGIALGALMMMLMMVRKAAPSAAGSDTDVGVFFGGGKGGKGARKRNDPEALDVGDDVIGEAGAGEAVLTGIELDDETLQSRKMVDEVSTMIKENPENAASLVKRWITKGK